MLSNKNRLLGLLVLGTIAATPSAHAVVAAGTSNGYGAGASILGLTVLPLTPFAFGVAPLPYTSAPPDVLTLGPMFVGPLGLSTGVLSAFATSDVDGGSGDRTTLGFGQVDGTAVNLGSLPGFSGTLSLTATVLNSTSIVTGDYGSLSRSGDSTITDLSLVFDQFIGPDVVFNVDPNVAPNTSLFSLLPALSPIGSALSALGINIILNEQFGTCDFVSFCEQTTNALHINAAPLGIEVADVILGHSYAAQFATPAIPEASTYGMMLAGLGLVGAMVARRRESA